MNLCINGYSDYVSQAHPEVCDSAAMPINTDGGSSSEFFQAGFLNYAGMSSTPQPPQEDNNRDSWCKAYGFFYRIAILSRTYTGVNAIKLQVDLYEANIFEAMPLLAVYDACIFFGLRDVQRFFLRQLDLFCKYPPTSPRGGRREFDERAVKDPGKHKFVPIVPEEVSVWEKIAAALAAAGAKALEVRKEADESAAAFAGAVGGALFIMPLSSDLLDFNDNPRPM